MTTMDDFYWFDHSSKEWGLFALFVMVTRTGKAESTQHHVEWLDARYESPGAMFAGNPSRIVGTPKASPEFVALWEQFRAKYRDWSRKRIKRAVETVEWDHYWRDRFVSLPEPKEGWAA